VTPPSTVLSLRRGFTYINIRNRDNPRFEAQAALDSAVKKGARIHVSPMFTYPPKSELTFIASYNPNFDSQRAALLAKLRAMSEVDWVKPAMFEEQYFHLDEGTPSPR
jgi:hypothetical protein